MASLSWIEIAQKTPCRCRKKLNHGHPVRRFRAHKKPPITGIIHRRLVEKEFVRINFISTFHQIKLDTNLRAIKKAESLANPAIEGRLRYLPGEKDAEKGLPLIRTSLGNATPGTEAPGAGLKVTLVRRYLFVSAFDNER